MKDWLKAIRDACGEWRLWPLWAAMILLVLGWAWISAHAPIYDNPYVRGIHPWPR